MRVFYHIGFWSSFVILFVYQNPKSLLQDYLSWLWILVIAAAVVYANFYVLLPRFFFNKKYVLYGVFLMASIVIGSYVTGFGLIAENENLRSDFIQNFINLSFFIILTSTLKFYRAYQQKQARLVKIENEQLKTELKLLKAQVNPHFLFNTLNNLYGLIIQHKNKPAAEITLKLADLMRYLLESSKAEKVKLVEEIQFLNDYLSLEKIRLSQNADIQFTTSGIDYKIQVAPLLFIPFVENAFKHGLQSLTKNSYAYFTIALQKNELLFEAENSLGKHLNQVPSGTGLENLKKRLELIYPEQHLLEIEKTEAHYKASLHITL